MIRIGIVGCGRILAAHLRGYQILREAGVDDFRITALCARRADDAAMYVRRGAGPPQRRAVSSIPGDPLAIDDVYLSDFQDDVEVQIFTDYRAMIDAAGIDAVNDFTPHRMHYEIAMATLERGKDLLTQKPLAASVPAARRICAEAEARRRVLGVFENARFRPATRHLQWLFNESQHAGRLQTVWIGSFGAWWAPDRIVADTPWRHARREAGGITLDMGVHQADMIRYIAGEITDVEGRTAVVEPRRVTVDARGATIRTIDCDADDTVFASFRTERGVVGAMAASWSGTGAPTLAGAGAVYYGSRGRATGGELRRDDGRSLDLAALYAAEADAATRDRHFPLGLEDQFALNQFDWLRAVRERGEPETNGWEGYRDLCAANAILASDRLGRRVAVEEIASGELDEHDD